MRKLLHLAAPAAMILFFVSFAAAQTVDDLVAKNLQSRGGEAKLRAVQSMRISSSMSMQGMQLSMTMTQKRPNLMRQEVVIQDKTVVVAFDGQTAWTINPMLGSTTPQAIQGPQGEMTREGADFDGPLMDYKTKGSAIELIKGDGPDGTEKLADGTKVYKLRVTRKGGQPRFLYLDAESGLERKMSTQMDQGGQTHTIEIELTDYRPEEGLMVPHTIRNVMDGQPMMQMTVQKVEFNVPVEDAYFKMPAK
jgi:outer membrane lipoprotein-sorting protein